MIRELLEFECRYHWRSPLFLLAAVCFTFFGFMFTVRGIRMPGVDINAPYMIAYMSSLLSLGSIFTATIFAVRGLLRDDTYQMRELVISTPLTKIRRLSIRFAGLFLTCFFLYSCMYAGILIGTKVPLVDANSVAGFEFLHYAWPWLLIGLPNTLFCVTVVILLAVTTRSRMAVYLGGLSLYILYVVGSIFSNAPWIASASPATADAISRAALLDPFAISAFFEQTTYWTTLERNSRLVSLEGNFLFNRLIWLGIAAFLLFAAYRLEGLVQPFRRRSKMPAVELMDGGTGYEPVDIVQGRDANRSAFWRLLRTEWRVVFRGLPFWIILLFWGFLFGVETLSMFEGGIRMAGSYPHTGQILSNIIEMLPMYATVVMIFYSGELLWRERLLKMHEINDALPVPNLVVIATKFAALVSIPFVLIMVSILCGVLIQISQGFNMFELGLYLQSFYYIGLPMMMIAVLALFCQLLFSNRYLGMAVTALLVLLLATNLSGLLGLNHPLLRFAAPLAVEFSDMNGFGQYASAFNWKMLYWGAFSIFPAIAAVMFWRRGTAEQTLLRFRAGWRNGGRRFMIPLAVSLGLCSLSGAYIFWQTNVEGDYMTRDERHNWAQTYEETYRRYRDVAQPTIRAVDIEVDLFPSQRYYRVSGRYEIINNSDAPLDSALVYLSPVCEAESLWIAGASMSKSAEAFGHMHYLFQPPLQVDETREMTFTVTSGWNGFVPHQPFNAIVGNGTFIRLSRYVPYFGYEAGNELSHPDLRRERGLPATETFPPLGAEDSLLADNPHPAIRFRGIVSTEADQHALLQGNLLREWEADDRRYFEYQLNHPIPFRFAAASARYDVVKTSYKGVAVEMFTHPEHRYNLDHIRKTLKQTLDYCSEQFGPYQYDHLRFVQVSQFTEGFAATAYPGMMFFRENMGLTADLRDSTQINHLFRGIAHEAAHQWWGGQLTPRFIEGRNMMTESLAKYTEYRLYEAAYGPAMAHESLDMEMELYLRNRPFEPEVPLYRVNDQAHVSYQKGALIFHAVADLLGEGRLNQALAAFRAKYPYPQRKPRSYDLLNELAMVASPEEYELINAWFRRVVMYDLQVASANGRALDDGTFEIEAKLFCRKYAEDADRKEVPLDIDEDLFLAIYAAGDDATYRSNPIYIQPFRAIGDSLMLNLKLDEKPGMIVIDPHLLRIEKNRMDNRRLIKMLN